MNKHGLEMSFKWIFAIIVGVAVLFFALYAVTKVIDTSQHAISSESAAQISYLTDPLETNYDSTNFLDFPTETRLYNDCLRAGDFGKQKISISEKSFDSWSKRGVNVTLQNKYFFSESIVEGKTMHLFSVPFEFPYKIGNLIIIYSGKYCFEKAPENIKDDLETQGLENVVFEDCELEQDFIQVCDGFSGCEIDIIEDRAGEGYVEKSGGENYYTGNLIYGAIFSSPEVYSCQVSRLAKKTSQLSKVYIEKSRFIAGSGCLTNLDSDLISFGSLTWEASSKDPRNFAGLSNQAEMLDIRNREVKATSCELW